MNRVVRLLAVTMVVIAACGGGGDGDADAVSTTTVPAPDDDSTTTTTTTTTTTAAPVAVGAGASGDFCGFMNDYIEDTDFLSVGMNAGDMEKLFTDNLDAIKQAAGIAPSEIRGDVDLFVDAYGGFVELMSEYDFNFLSVGTDARDDPRMLAMEDPALEAAGERIEDFCGIEGEFIATQPPSDGGGGTGGVVPGAALPDDFPGELVPPGGEVAAAFDVSGMQTVGFEVESSGDDVIDYYTSLLGEPLFESSEPFGAAWSAQYEGSTVNVTIAEYAPGQVNVNVIIE